MNVHHLIIMQLTLAQAPTIKQEVTHQEEKLLAQAQTQEIKKNKQRYCMSNHAKRSKKQLPKQTFRK